MPSNRLKNLLDTCKKSINRVWSKELIEEYRRKAFDIVQSNLDLGNTEEYIQLLKLLRGKDTAYQLSQLPQEYPEETIEFDESETRVHRPHIMATAYITPPAFFKEGDNFVKFIGAIENYLKVIKVTDDEQKRDILLYLLGSTEETLKNCAHPADIERLTWAQLKELGLKTFGAGITQEQAYIEFFSVRQSNEETGVQYAKKIKELAKKANILDERIIINRLIEGIKSEKVKFELLKAKIIKFDELLVQLTFLETITKSAEVNKINFNKNKKFNKKPNQKKDVKNGKKNEAKSTEKTCFFCKKAGHFKKQCFGYKKWLEKKGKSQANEVKPEDSIGSLYD